MQNIETERIIRWRRAQHLTLELKAHDVETLFDVRYFFHALVGVRLALPNGETWEVAKVSTVLYRVRPHSSVARYIPVRDLTATRIMFRGGKIGEKRRAIYDTAKTPGKVTAAIVTAFQEQLECELQLISDATPILDAVARYCTEHPLGV